MEAKAMTGTEMPRPMRTEALAEWRREGAAKARAPVRPLVPGVSLAWLQGVAPFIDPDLADLPGFPVEPVSGWSNIGGVLRCSRTFCFILADGPPCLLVVNRDAYRVWTTLAELWDCRLSISQGKHLPLLAAQEANRNVP